MKLLCHKISRLECIMGRCCLERCDPQAGRQAGIMWSVQSVPMGEGCPFSAMCTPALDTRKEWKSALTWWVWISWVPLLSIVKANILPAVSGVCAIWLDEHTQSAEPFHAQRDHVSLNGPVTSLVAKKVWVLLIDISLRL